MDKYLQSFVDSLQGIEWFSHAGEPSEGVRVVDGMQTGWDREGKQMLVLWDSQTHAIEKQAWDLLGDQGIDRIFSVVAQAIHEPLYSGISSYLDRIYSKTNDDKRTFDEGVLPDVIESVKRDVCWAGVEHALHVHGFFGRLLAVYRQGRWACSWDGSYPQGQPVIL